MKLKIIFALVLPLALQVCSINTYANAKETKSLMLEILKQKQWRHGSADCEVNRDPELEVFQFDESSFVLRQNKCLTYEAPFIYVLIGSERILVLDTGATKSELGSPLYDVLQSLIEKQLSNKIDIKPEILVIHSHGHSDHHSGDSQFVGKENVTLILPNRINFEQFFGFDANSELPTYIDLGNRKISIIPTPGHQEEAISIYDPQTQWLLTGDTFYPGKIYVKHWEDYKNSIARLALFMKNNEVGFILGSHIEMTNRAGEYYPVGTSYQPDEASLVLMPRDLVDLHAALKKSTKAESIIMDNFVVEPLGALQKVISSIVRWLIH